MYLIISFYLDIASLASLMCHNRLDCLDYNYVPPSIEKFFITRSINKPYFLPAIYFTVGGFVIFFFCEFFRVDQRRLTFERLDLLVSFHLPSKSELQLPDASLLLRSDLFKSYRIILGFDFRAYSCCLIQINSQFIDICQLYRFYLLFQLLSVSIQLGILLIGRLSY